MKDQSKQNPGSVSGPTSSDSFALTLTSQSVSSVLSRTKSKSKAPLHQCSWVRDDATPHRRCVTQSVTKCMTTQSARARVGVS
ncbi:hypothetical protein JN853_09470 [Pseudomonas syringae pv. actinidiae ICMP 9853]|nr:hypothetical protein JN853_09470 [Pseudomonas syringae pv. actinidiae ICMP 9853]